MTAAEDVARPALGRAEPVARREKVLVHAAYPVWRKNTLVTLARARELKDEGHAVVLTHCDASRGPCRCNYSANPLICRICRSNFRASARRLGLEPRPLAVRPADPAPEREPLAEPARRELEDGVASGLISMFRVLERDLDRVPRLARLRREYLHTASELLRGLDELVRRERPDRVETFNGRHACGKSALVAARTHGVPYNTLEVAANRRPILFRGHTPHDRSGVQARMLEQPADLELAERVFAARRRPRSNRYARHHSRAFRPPDTGHGRRIAVFLSSQDEFESLGDSWSSPFDADHRVLLRLALRFPDTFFAVRFHPNQAGIKSDITSDFAPLAALPNTRLYLPTADADSYALVDWADVVVTFNSTVAVEACWTGKPSVILGPSFYDELDVAHTPADEAAAVELLARHDLAPLPREHAARYAHYAARGGDDFRYLAVEGGDLRPRGFARARPWLNYLARYADQLWCQGLRRSIPPLGPAGA